MSYFTIPSETVGVEQIVCNECGYVSKTAGKREKNLKEHMSEYHPETMLKYVHEMETFPGKILCF